MKKLLKRVRLKDQIPTAVFDELRQRAVSGDSEDVAARVAKAWSTASAAGVDAPADWYENPDGTYSYGR